MVVECIIRNTQYQPVRETIPSVSKSISADNEIDETLPFLLAMESFSVSLVLHQPKQWKIVVPFEQEEKSSISLSI